MPSHIYVYEHVENGLEVPNLKYLWCVYLERKGDGSMEPKAKGFFLFTIYFALLNFYNESIFLYF